MQLTDSQVEQFWADGVLVVPDAVSGESLQALRTCFADWVEQSRSHDRPFGEGLDGRPRFDLEAGHNALAPALRRVNAPCEISQVYRDAMADSPMTDMVADLIGPNVKHHHNKINSKLPGAPTVVKWHQDFPFTPHTNTDLVTALPMVDEVTEENGPLEVLPGSHRGPLYSLWHDSTFTGAVAEADARVMQAGAVRCTGGAGSVCLMHTCLAHGSAANLSSRPRTLFISVYSAADAMPVTRNPVPNEHEGLIVRGEDPKIIRASGFEVRIPAYPKSTSFFSQQASADG
ncbi:MAG: phytanoyl-CoA dioxygenase family protein [Gammaproteobacteria bacterium]